MKNIKITFFVLLLFSLLSACKDLEGNLSFFEDIRLLDHKERARLVPTGNYRAELDYKEKKHQIKLKIKDAIKNKKDLKLKLNLPKTAALPTTNGSIDIRASQIGQPFDLKGLLRTHTSYSGHHHGRQACTYQVKERVCEKICEEDVSIVSSKGKHGGVKSRHRQRCRKKCNYEYIDYQGTREVQYHYRRKNITLKGDLFKPHSQKKIGYLNVGRKDSSRIYDYQGPCL